MAGRANSKPKSPIIGRRGIITEDDLADAQEDFPTYLSCCFYFAGLGGELTHEQIMETQLARDLIAEWEEKTDRASRIEILEDIFHLYSKEDFEAPPDPVGHLTVGPNGEVYRRLASGKYKVERARHR